MLFRSWFISLAGALAVNSALAAPNPAPATKPVVIAGKSRVAPPTWGFQLTKGKQPGTLVLSFFSRDRRLHFDSTGPFVIQFNMPPAIHVSPSVITGSEWPKAPSPLTLTLSGVAPGKHYRIAGAAGYSLCGPNPKSCRRVKTLIHYQVDG